MRTIGLAFIMVALGTATSLGQDSDTTHWADLFSDETLVYEAKFGFITLGSGMMHTVGVDTIRGTPTLHTVFVLKGGGFIYRLHYRMD